MKAVTEFNNFTLNKALTAKAALTAEGKTPEEIQTSIGETFKLEGDKLKYFINAMDVASANVANLKRVLVMSLAEGENPPAKSAKHEELYYVPDFLNLTPFAQAKAGGKGDKPRGGKGRGGDSKKGSPWGLSPEEKAAKNKGGAPKA